MVVVALNDLVTLYDTYDVKCYANTNQKHLELIQDFLDLLFDRRQEVPDGLYKECCDELRLLYQLVKYEPKARVWGLSVTGILVDETNVITPRTYRAAKRQLMQPITELLTSGNWSCC